MSEKKGYIDNVEFLKHLRDFEECYDGTDNWFMKTEDKINRDADRKTKKRCLRTKEDYVTVKAEVLEYIYKDIERRTKIREFRIQRSETETEIEKQTRAKRLECVKNRIGRCFLLIAENYIKKPNFIGYDSYRKGAMISDACEIMYRYIERFDTNMDNPLSFFTQQAHNAFLQNINNVNKRESVILPVSYIENVNGSQLGESNE